MSVVVSQPSASIPRGRSAGGPTSVTRAPIRTSAWTFERATRECRTSPTMAPCGPSIRPRRVGSFFISRSSERSKVRAVASSRSTSSRLRSRIEIRCRRAGGPGGSRSSRMTRMSPIALLFGGRDQQDAVDLVHLDELHLDALLARGRKVLADVVGSDRKLAVAAVDEDRQLDARGAAVVEERVDRRPDRAAGVEDVVDEDAGAAFEREVELGGADDGLRVEGRLAPANPDVVAVERDVDGPERDLLLAPLRDQPAQAVGERPTARLDADERDLVEIRVPLDDLVGDPRGRPVERDLVQEHLPRGAGRQRHSTPFRPLWTGLKGFGSRGLYNRGRTTG